MERLEDPERARKIRYNAITSRRGRGFLGGRQLDDGEYDCAEIVDLDSPIRYLRLLLFSSESATSGEHLFSGPRWRRSTKVLPASRRQVFKHQPALICLPRSSRIPRFPALFVTAEYAEYAETARCR